VDQVDHGDHDPPWWTRSVQDHRGPPYDIFLMLLIVTCIHSGLSWVALVESLDRVFCIVEVFRGVPDFIVFW